MRRLLVCTAGALLALASCGDNEGEEGLALTGATLSTDEDTALVHTLSARGPEGSALTFQATTPAHGAIAIDRAMLTYTPAENYHGTDTFTVTVSSGGQQATADFTVTVRSVNDAPVATGDSFAAAEDTPLVQATSALLANDTDADGDSLSVTAVQGATNGTVAIAGGMVTFTPAADFSGAASFQYTATDGTDTSTATVMVTVGGANDAPVAGDDTADTNEDIPLELTSVQLVANDTDPESQTLTVTGVDTATNGTVSFAAGTATFTPAANFSGTATFQYTVSDGADSDTATVTITVAAVNDLPVAGADAGTTDAGVALSIPLTTLLANDSDIDGPSLSITSVQGFVNGTAVLGAGDVTFTPALNFSGAASFQYTLSDGGGGTATGTVAITVNAATLCGDGMISVGETCDDGDTDPGDGCSATCGVEPGWTCMGAPSSCFTTCGDGVQAGTEACDDGNMINTDGCTAQCVVGAVCNAGALPGADRFGVDPATGHCYASYDGELTTFADAQTACVAAGGYLATVTSAGENTVVTGVQNTAENPWIGASEDGNDTDAVFDWVTDEAFGFTAFAPGQPDDDAGVGGNGECLHIVDAQGRWNDTNCDLATFVVGRICELEAAPCGDSVLQPVTGEECDDGDTDAGDGCSATCQLEDGCGDGNVDAGEQCDDDNTASGDGCSATCQAEVISIAITPAPLSLAQQQRVQLKATATFFGGATLDVTATAAWASTAAAVATVGTGGANNGRLESQAQMGSATITATLDGITGTTTVNVSAATCSIRINEVQVAGDGGSAAADEFSELYNPCTTTIDVTGWTLVYRSAANTNDVSTAIVNLTGTMAPGAFRFYVGVGYNGGGTPDGQISMSATGTYAGAGGGVGLRSGPANTGAIVDGMVWGTAVAAHAFFEGTGTAPTAPPANRSLIRAPYDGADTNTSATDFVLTNAAGTPPTVPTPGTTNYP